MSYIAKFQTFMVDDTVEFSLASKKQGISVTVSNKTQSVSQTISMKDLNVLIDALLLLRDGKDYLNNLDYAESIEVLD